MQLFLIRIINGVPGTKQSDPSTERNGFSSAEAESEGHYNTKAWIAGATVAWNIAPEFSVQPGVEYQWTQGEGGRIDGTPKVSDLAFFLSAEYKPWEWLEFTSQEPLSLPITMLR